MKYLSTYRIFEDQSVEKEIRDTLNDISLEMKDDGYLVGVTINPRGDTHLIGAVCINIDQEYDINDENSFRVADVVDSIKRIISYMEEEGYRSTTISLGKPSEKVPGGKVEISKGRLSDTYPSSVVFEPIKYIDLVFKK